MSTSGTPRTDAQFNAIHPSEMLKHPQREIACAYSLARQLERELRSCEAALAAAQARVAELETQLEAHAWKVSPAMAQAQIYQLNARIAELERDRARLDWLDKALIAEYSNRRNEWVINHRESAPTLRAAIDAAMSEANNPQTLPHA